MVEAGSHEPRKNQPGFWFHGFLLLHAASLDSAAQRSVRTRVWLGVAFARLP
jgi:hypothetical protein